MGAGSSRRKFESLTSLSKEEKEGLQHLFSNISSGNHETNAGHMEAYIKKWTTEYMSRVLLKSMLAIEGKQGQVSLITFAELASLVLKMSVDNETDFILKSIGDPPQSQHLKEYVKNMFQSYAKCAADSAELSKWSFQSEEAEAERFAEYILQDLVFEKMSLKACFDEEFPLREITRDKLERWYLESQLFPKLQQTVFSRVFLGKSQPSMVPLPVQADSVRAASILKLADVLTLNSGIPVEYRKKWRLLFSTRLHGESFSTLLGKIMRKGATLLIIRDKTACVFGGYAPISWSCGPKYFDCYHPNPWDGSTGYNSNYLYLNTNQKTMPNGLGFGGRLEYFGLWLDSEFGTGRANASCTTYHSPQLCKSQEFYIDHMEVWGVGEEPEVDETERASVLDVDPEAKALLEMAGRRMASDGIRESDAKDK
ncbi:unnamed protein product [Darwinula stevensoni]|uniref:MTOR-associated protein MEAK7 n=1 Tax=Darwinula stevensoni TaxID=69355 RepID=A0A7R9A3Q2_9CRUS|nr:unnamed protein product [Darwinula stevensoni]CAG0888458.1 unnamed protein product [Darwinula stevensoni]